jgi:hypothetical protein
MTTLLKKEIVFCALLLSVLVAITLPGSAVARSAKDSRRIALVIGNAAYPQYPLKNPLNDARGMAEVLNKSHFEVTLLENAGRRKMEETISAFGKRLYNGDVGLFYFAGHGVQFEGSNYLIPVDAVINDEVDVKYEAVNASRILDKMKQAKNDVNIVILDACRNNPFASSDRAAGGSASRGLTKMFSPVGSFVAYATAPGSVSADGNGEHGIYTKYLLKFMQEPGLTIEQVFKKVRKAVRHETDQKQTPWENSSLMGDFYFIQAESVTIKPAPVPEKPVTGSIVINTEPARAKIWIDEGFEGRSPLEIPNLSPGLIVVKAGKKGYRNQQEKVHIRAGRRSELTLQLAKVVPVTGTLNVLPEPADALVVLQDSKDVYRKGMELAAGFHKIEVSRKGYDPAVLSVDIVAGRDTEVRVVLQESKEEIERKAQEALALAELQAQLKKQRQEEELKRENEKIQAQLAREKKREAELVEQVRKQEEQVAAALALKKKKEEELARQAREEQKKEKRRVKKEQEKKQAQENRLRQLLTQADRQIKAYRLATPAGNNAVETLKKVLLIVPGDLRVQNRVSEIVAAYTRLGEKEAARYRFDKAGQRFQQGKKIAEEFHLPQKEIDSLDQLLAGLQQEREKKAKQDRILKENRNRLSKEQENRERIARQQRRDRQLKEQRAREAREKARQEKAALAEREQREQLDREKAQQEAEAKKQKITEQEDVRPVKKPKRRRVIGIF